MNVEIKKLSDKDIKDFSELIVVFENVFEWENLSLPDQIHLQKVISSPHFIAFVAKTEDQLIGGLTAHILDRYDTEKPSVYIYDLAVLTEYQRQGIGRKLIAALNEYCDKRGFHEVFVQAETDDFQAVGFYRTTPISQELQATHFTYSLHKAKQ